MQSLFDPGQLQGLSLILDNHEFALTAAPRQNHGFKILLHSRDELPYNLQDFGVEIDMGKHTSVRIEPREVGDTLTHLWDDSSLSTHYNKQWRSQPSLSEVAK